MPEQQDDDTSSNRPNSPSEHALSPDSSSPDAVREVTGARPRAVLVGIQLPERTDQDLEASLTELGRLEGWASSGAPSAGNRSQ